MPRAKSVSDEAVLDAAIAVMFRAGPADFTLCDVAKAAGLAPATLIQRFRTKHGLVTAAVRRESLLFAEALRALPVAKGRDAVVELFLTSTPGPEAENAFPDQLLWLREDYRNPELNVLARERFRLLRDAVIARMPALPLPAESAARLVEAQWHGALVQWGLEPEGHLRDYVRARLNAWFALVQPEDHQLGRRPPASGSP